MTHRRQTSRAALALACAALATGAAACGESSTGGQDTPSPTSAAVASSSAAPTTSSSPAAPPTTSAEPTISTDQAEPVGAAEGIESCTNRPADPDTYADAYVRAWGVGDQALMHCLATDEAVAYSLRYRDALGPGWDRIRQAGEGTRVVEFGSPNHKTVAAVTVDAGMFTGGMGAEHAVRQVSIG